MTDDFVAFFAVKSPGRPIVDSDLQEDAVGAAKSRDLGHGGQQRRADSASSKGECNADAEDFGFVDGGPAQDVAGRSFTAVGTAPRD